jgi:sulfate transport system permease protein
MPARLSLRFAALGYLAAIIVVPCAMIFYRTFEHGWTPFWKAMTAPEAVHALKLTVGIALIAVPANTFFGIVCALWLIRSRSRMKILTNALIDLPLALSPVVVALALMLLYARNGWFNGFLTQHGIQIIFALPSMVLATVFVSLPFVVREVAPVLREIGAEQEEAAWTLGASPLRTFLRITLPAIRWAVTYGVVLTTARAIGEFGAVRVVSGGLAGQTETLTVYVEGRFESYDYASAYASSVVLCAVAVAILLTMNLLKPRHERRRSSSGHSH